MRSLWQAARSFSDDNCLQLAAALAFYTILSLAPLLVLLINIGSLFVAPKDVEGKVAATANDLLGPQGAEQLKTMMQPVGIARDTFSARLFSIVVLVIGATGAMVQLQSSLNQIWKARTPPGWAGVRNFLFKRLLSLAMIPALALLVLVSIVVTPVLWAVVRPLPLDSGLVGFILNDGLTYLMVLAALIAVFKLLPDVPVSWKHALLGAAVTAVLFVVGKFLIGLYLAHENLGSTYGAASSLVFVLLWTYYSSLILLFGAELTHVWSERSAAAKPRS
jgi:membrane protein